VLKFNVLKAFHTIFKSGSKKEIPTIEIVKQNEVNQKTVWPFKRIFQERLSVQGYNLTTKFIRYL
jgi:hypothetical protein